MRHCAPAARAMPPGMPLPVLTALLPGGLKALGLLITAPVLGYSRCPRARPGLDVHVLGTLALGRIRIIIYTNAAGFELHLNSIIYVFTYHRLIIYAIFIIIYLSSFNHLARCGPPARPAISPYSRLAQRLAQRTRGPRLCPKGAARGTNGNLRDTIRTRGDRCRRPWSAYPRT